LTSISTQQAASDLKRKKKQGAMYFIRKKISFPALNIICLPVNLPNTKESMNRFTYSCLARDLIFFLVDRKLEPVNNKNFDKFEELFVSMDVFRYISIFFISLINMKILVFMFEGPIS